MRQVYKVCLLMGLAYTLKRMLNPLITHTHVHTHTHANTRTHMPIHIHTPPRGAYTHCHVVRPCHVGCHISTK